MDGAWSILIQREESLPMAGAWNRMGFQVPLQPKAFHDSVVPQLFSKAGPCPCTQQFQSWWQRAGDETWRFFLLERETWP